MQPMNDSLPWYREPWPWLLMAGPAVVVVAGFYTLALAIHSDDGLVAEDYYTQGLTINRQLARSDYAKAKNISARAEFSGARVHVIVSSDIPLPSALKLRIIHPTRAGEDREIILVAGQEGEYTGSLPVLSHEARQLVLEDSVSTWRIEGNLDKAGGNAYLEP
jgi:hypothetical protein